MMVNMMVEQVNTSYEMTFSKVNTCLCKQITISHEMMLSELTCPGVNR